MELVLDVLGFLSMEDKVDVNNRDEYNSLLEVVVQSFRSHEVTNSAEDVQTEATLMEQIHCCVDCILELSDMVLEREPEFVGMGIEMGEEEDGVKHDLSEVSDHGHHRTVKVQAPILVAWA